MNYNSKYHPHSDFYGDATSSVRKVVSDLKFEQHLAKLAANKARFNSKPAKEAH